MGTPLLTLNVSASNAARTLAAIERAERFGLAGIWVPTMGVGPDGLTSLAAAAVRAERVSLGTGVLPAFTRHPLALAQQALAVAQLAPGRLRLGIGTSHRQGMEGTFGVEMRSPLRHLRECVLILKAALAGGTVEHAGPRYTVRARVAAPEPPVPVPIAALGAGAFRLAGEVADGAVSWLCPPAYLERVALPALREGAARAGRTPPPLIAGLPVAVTRDTDAVQAAVEAQLAGYVRAPYYQQMLVAAGLPEAASGRWSGRMIEDVVLAGEEEALARRFEGLAAAGIDEVAVTPLLVGPDPRAAMQRTLSLLAALTSGGRPSGGDDAAEAAATGAAVSHREERGAG